MCRRRARLDRRLARAGRRGRARDRVRVALGRRPPGVLALPRRVLHRLRRAAPQGSATRRTSAPSTRRPSWARRPSCWCPAACPRTTATSRRPGPSHRGDRARSFRTRATPACGSASSRCTRSSPPTAVSSPRWPGAGHRRAVPGRPGRRRRRHLPRVVGAGRAGADRPRRRPDRVVPDRRLDHAAAARRPALPRHGRRRPHRLRLAHPGGGRRRLRAATWRSRSSTPTSGPRPATRWSRPWPGATSNSWSRF